MIPVSTKKLQDNHGTNFKAYLDYDNVHPGYARICIPGIKQDDDSFVFDGDVGKQYLSSTRYMRKLVSNLFKYDKEETTEVTIQGPAITLDNHIKLTAANMNTPDGTVPTDLVCALPCLPWPEIANSIKDRAVKSEWLQFPFVDSIVNDGCHIVAVPSKSSKKPELEWRISFSASEGRLAREVVTDKLRQCYVFLKILRYQSMKSKSILSSYVFKSVFLHCCEQLPVHYWKYFPGNCVLYMLDVLLECLEKKHVPTYFLPENNLIDHLTDDEITTAISAVEKLRLDPITPILVFMEDKMFACHCIKLKFRTMVKPLLDDIKEY
ncbi:nucleotidyltransferase MB21D2-like [Mercenaria mercenaria]|uniref:nucleotidyltransferase MB21D2-like n=1 Tax=Mercenaria mercenaria TaxID=6596 RepID=UPI00234F7CAD|nr:nucleotidyltransferase MB21D2-like [Mercenaria mercenaria]